MRKLVLWGHNVDDYREMFDLREEELDKNLLEIGCGPSAVNSQLTQLGKTILSCDALFSQTVDELLLSVEDSSEHMIEEIKKHQHLFQWGHFGDLEGFIAARRRGVKEFFADYKFGKQQGRYLSSDDDELPFEDFQFDVALCSHYLFANLDNQDLDYHLRVIRELSRVAKEVRIFPLIDRQSNVSQFLGPVLLGLQQQHLGVEVKQVNYQLQAKGNAMLRVWALQCDVA